MRKLLSPYIADPSAAEIVRARICTHHSRLADRFVVGRTLLAGDAIQPNAEVAPAQRDKLDAVLGQ